MSELPVSASIPEPLNRPVCQVSRSSAIRPQSMTPRSKNGVTGVDVARSTKLTSLSVVNHEVENGTFI
jgi:hypothetical protein